ncbi:MAG: heme ABC transporter ATP-binding protein, partial [Dehalococcoidia bacterium]|nr:heme ABC transporter ATP-binding protein [Dehalococcoidia bacterium]
LSGGNLQRVVLARELSRTPRVLIACYPTRGLDVKTAEMTRSLLVSARKQGTAVLLISEDLDELFALSDRLFVMYEGAIVHESSPRQTTPREVGLVMTGHGVE